MTSKSNLAPTVLFVLGCIDLLRGFLHTFVVRWSAARFAHLNLSANGPDQLTLLGAFGISNLLTGMIYLLVSRKAPAWSEYVLMMIVAAYVLGIAGMRISGIRPQAQFTGRYFMAAYLGVCLVTVVVSRLRG